MSIADINRLYEHVVSSPDVYAVLKDDLYLADSIVAKLEQLDAIKDKTSREYVAQYNDIVSVGEFPVG
jgi:hypothetical protein